MKGYKGHHLEGFVASRHFERFSEHPRFLSKEVLVDARILGAVDDHIEPDRAKALLGLRHVPSRQNKPLPSRQLLQSRYRIFHYLLRTIGFLRVKLFSRVSIATISYNVKAT